jgi:hypothetical protein
MREDSKLHRVHRVIVELMSRYFDSPVFTFRLEKTDIMHDFFKQRY